MRFDRVFAGAFFAGLLTVFCLAATPLKNVLLQGNMDAGGFVITNVATSTNLSSVATRGYVGSNFLSTNFTGSFATAAQGTLASTALQPGGAIGTSTVASGPGSIALQSQIDQVAISQSTRANLVAWWRASDLHVTNGAAVTSWTDATGVYTLVATGTPTFATSGTAGMPAVRFGSGKYFTGTANMFPTSINSALTIITVSESNTAAGTPLVPVSFGSVTYLLREGELYKYNVGGTDLALLGPTISRPTICTLRIGGGTFESRRNGYLQDSGSKANSTIANQVFSIGSYNSGSFIWDDDVYEVLIFSSKLTDREINQVENYLVARYLPPFSQSRLVVFDGDSITEGVGAGDGQAWWYLLTANLPGNVTVKNFSNSSQTFADMLADYSVEAGAAFDNRYSKPVLMVFSGNEMVSGSAATAYANTEAYCQALRKIGYTVIVGSCLPRTTSGFNAKRNDYNALLRAGWTAFADGFVDQGANSTIGPDAAASNATYYGDGVHPADAATAIMWPMWKAEYDRLTSPRSPGVFVYSGTTNFVLTATTARTVVVNSGTFAVTGTLPVLAGNTNLDFEIKNNSTGALAIARQGSDLLYTTGTATSISITNGQRATVVNDGAYWTTFGPN